MCAGRVLALERQTVQLRATLEQQDFVLAGAPTATLKPVLTVVLPATLEQATMLHQDLVLAVRPTANTGATRKSVWTVWCTGTLLRF